MIRFTIPIRTPSVSNLREHWARKAERVKSQRRATWAACREAYGRWLPEPISCVVTLTRVAPRQLDDDNVRGALKAVRDEVAAWLGVDDRDSRVRWEYGQEKGDACVRVEVVSESGPASLDAALAAYGRGKR